MRRIVIAVAGTVTGLVLLFSYPTSLNRSASVATAAAGEGSGTTTGAGSSSKPARSESTASESTEPGSTLSTGDSGSFEGDSVQTRFGTVQVEIVVADGVVSSAEAVQYPSRDRESRQINAWAVPVLNDEVVSAQSATISMVSGATVTSAAYLRSLQSAFDAAGL